MSGTTLIQSSKARTRMPCVITIIKKCCIVTFLVVAALFLFATPAKANIFDDAVGSINKWISDTILVPFINAQLNFMYGLMRQITDGSLIMAPFTDLFGHNSNLYTIAVTVQNTTIKPIAHSILALVMMCQLVKISERVDGSATMPAIKEIVSLAVFYTIFVWLINNSGDILIAAYNDLLKITSGIGAATQVQDLTVSIAAEDSISIGVFLVVALCGVLIMIGGVLAYLVSLLMIYARSIQLYVYLMFSPIPFALLGFEGTRQMGIGFLKNFISLCLSGAIMLFVLFAFPALFSMIVGDAASLSNLPIGVDLVASLLIPLKMLIMCLLLAFCMIKSGAWAREIFGG